MAERDMFDLAGRVALVTGASRGIGEAVARCLAAHGAHVIVASRRVEGCEMVAAAIRAAGGEAEAMACHIGEMAQIEAAFAAIRERHGRLDILVNNAATNPYFGPIEATDLAAFQKTVDVNIRGYFFMTTGAIALMRGHGGGSIVNVASVNGVLPGAMQGIYSITKSAVIGMTRCFAQECASLGVRVNAILPGLTETKFAGALFTDADASVHWQARIAMARAAQPSEMTGAVLYLVSDAASYVTGASLPVDGGYLVT